MLTLPCRHDPAKLGTDHPARPRVRTVRRGLLLYVRQYDRAEGDCSVCFVGLTRESPNRAYGGDGRVLPVLPNPATSLPVCEYEGGVIAACTSCNPEAREAKSVRACSHPENVASGLANAGKTTRGPNDGAGGLWTCADCEYHTGRGSAILLTGGIGDLFALDGVMTPEEKERLETVYYAAPAARELRELLADNPAYPRLKNHTVLPSGAAVHYTKAAVEKAHGPLPGVADWTIQAIFPQKRRYVGSSFLSHRLADVKEHPPGPFVVVVPHSTWGRWNDRSFNATDWAACFETLERHDFYGVVLCRETLPLPAHPRLLDWQGRTTIRETVEVLKAAAGYLGIDSALSVLAAKLFPASRLSVKSVWQHCYDNRGTYFAPRTEFPFLARSLRPWA